MSISTKIANLLALFKANKPAAALAGGGVLLFVLIAASLFGGGERAPVAMEKAMVESEAPAPEAKAPETIVKPEGAVMGVDLTKVPKLGDLTMMPPADFEAATRLEERTDVYNDPLLSYSLRIPKDWTGNAQQDSEMGGQAVLSDRVLAILGRYIAPPKNLVRSYVTVEAVALSEEVTVRNWLVNFVLTNGFTLGGLNLQSDREMEAVYVQVINDDTYAVRARAIINGARLVLVRHYLPQDNFQEERALQAQIVQSFKLLSLSNAQIETSRQYGFLDQSYFNYPTSWTLTARPIYSVERMSANLSKVTGVDRGRRVEGQIAVRVISRLLRTTLAQEVQDFRDRLEIPGYTVGAMIENIDYTFDTSIRSGKVEVYQLVPDDRRAMNAYELVVSVLEGDDYYYILNMITPSRKGDYFVWARNMQTYEMINKSVRRTNLRYDENDPYFDYLKEVQ